MTSQQIEYVLTLAQLKSFSKAAQKLYVTQPSLSQYIMNIEKQIGTPLFDRSTSPIRLTQAGEIFVKTAEKIKALEDNMNNELMDMANLKNGSLKLGTSTFRASCMLAQSIAEFSNKYEGITVSVTESDTEQLKTMLKSNELDVIIGTGNFEDGFFHKEELADERLYLAVPKGRQLDEKLASSRLEKNDITGASMKFLTAQPIDLSLVKNENFVCSAHGEFGEEIVAEICAESGFKPDITLAVKTIETAFSLVTAGLGITLIPDTLIRFGNFSVHPDYYPIDESISQRKIYLVSRKSGYFSKAAAEYCLLLKQLVDIGTWRI